MTTHDPALCWEFTYVYLYVLSCTLLSSICVYVHTHHTHGKMHAKLRAFQLANRHRHLLAQKPRIYRYSDVRIAGVFSETVQIPGSFARFVVRNLSNGIVARRQHRTNISVVAAAKTRLVPERSYPELFKDAKPRQARIVANCETRLWHFSVQQPTATFLTPCGIIVYILGKSVNTAMTPTDDPHSSTLLEP